MSFALLVFLLLSFCLGLVLVFVGTKRRRGITPRCASCEYAIVGLRTEACPECNADLSRDGAIVAGERRRTLTWVGGLILLASALAFAYLVVQNPALDDRKPVVLLAIELRFTGPGRESRVAEALTRRLNASTSPETNLRIMRLASERLRDGRLSVSMLRLYSQAAQSPLPAGSSAEALHGRTADSVLAQWKNLSYPDQGNIASLTGHMLAAGPLSDAQLEELRDLFRSTYTVGDPESIPQQYRQEKVTRLLAPVYDRVIADSALADSDQLRLIIPDLVLEFQTRERIAGGLDALPFTVKAHVPQVPGSLPIPVTRFTRFESITVNGEPIDERFNLGSSSQPLYTSIYPSLETTTSGLTLPLDTPSPGTYRVEANYRVVIVHHPDHDSLTTYPWDDDFDPVSTKILSDERFALEATTEFLPLGEETVTLLTPGRGFVPTEEHLLSYIRVGELEYLMPTNRDPRDYPLRLKIARERSHAVPHSSEVLDTRSPEVDFAFRVVALQDEHSWELGTFTIRRVLRGGDFFTYLHPYNEKYNRTTRKLITIPEPDLSRPVRIVLRPDPYLAERTTELETIIGVELNLGEFDPVRVPGDVGRSYTSDEKLDLPPAIRGE